MGNFTYDRYHDYPDQYDRLIRGEDYEGHLIPALTAIHPLANARVVEFGAGTGRVTHLLAPHVERIHAFELIYPMIKVGQDKMLRSDFKNWTVGVASNDAVPVPSRIADIAIEGWSFLQMVRWNFERWPEVLDRAVGEMQRVLKPGGAAILIETLGTGREDPQPPADWFAEVYAYLEQKHGFEATWIRTDMQFASAEEAAELLGFFFGEEMAQPLVNQWGAVIPECTGLWWQRV